jgi:glycosyltransferase involved in cell wall biosynthesis
MDSADDEQLPDVSVVIPAHNAATTLPAQLAALAAQDFTGSWELVVVENGSVDGTRAEIDAWQERIPRLRCIVSTTPGASRARNLGVRSARAPLVLLCDADDVVTSGWISAMAQALRDFELVGGPIEFEELNAAQLPRPNVTVGPDLPVVFGYPYAISANIGFHRKLFDTIGGFDESFAVPGSEDTDYGWRAHFAGYSMGAAPSAVVHYRLRATLKAFLRQQYRYAKSHSQVYAKHLRDGHLPKRTLRRQTKAFAGDVYDALRAVPRSTSARAWWELLGRVAWVAGTFVGALRYGVYV